MDPLNLLKMTALLPDLTSALRTVVSKTVPFIYSSPLLHAQSQAVNLIAEVLRVQLGSEERHQHTASPKSRKRAATFYASPTGLVTLPDDTVECQVALYVFHSSGSSYIKRMNEQQQKRKAGMV